MFTNRDKIKEQILFMTTNKHVDCLVTKNERYKPVGVSVVMRYKYSLPDIDIFYDKWIVENYEDALKMNLPGCEHHDQLVKGSGVNVLSKKLGYFIFYEKDAETIINACEYNNDFYRLIVANPLNFQR